MKKPPCHKQHRKSQRGGEELFNEFYGEIFGLRWETLKASLLGPKKYILLAPPFLGYPTEDLPPFLNLPHLYEVHKGKEEKSDQCYFLDGASALAPLALKVSPGERVLDLCAAPGGKSLLLALQLQEKGELVANDKSPKRRERLRKTLSHYLKEEFFSSHIKITGHDAGRWCLYEREAYDKILLDAPCSSERHVLMSPHHLSQWKKGRTKRLSAIQWTMLASAWQVLKPKGRLVYSTCSLSPLENDQVVEKLYKKFGDEVKPLPNPFPLGSPSSWGTWITPDTHGHGPFYFSILEKA